MERGDRLPLGRSVLLDGEIHRALPFLITEREDAHGRAVQRGMNRHLKRRHVGYCGNHDFSSIERLTNRNTPLTLIRHHLFSADRRRTPRERQRLTCAAWASLGNVLTGDTSRRYEQVVDSIVTDVTVKVDGVSFFASVVPTRALVSIRLLSLVVPVASTLCPTCAFRSSPFS